MAREGANIKILDIDGDVINPSTETKQDNIITKLNTLETGKALASKQLPDNHNVTVSNPTADPELIYPTGSGSNGSVTLTNANTAYAVPSTASTKKHILTIYNDSDVKIYIGYENSNSGGVVLNVGGSAEIFLGVSQQIYAYCQIAGTIINYTLKEI